jgi:hypothetical protein
MNTLKSRIFYNVCIFTVFLFFSLFITYPAIRHFQTNLIGDGGDSIEYLSYQYLAQNNLKSGKSPFFYSYQFRYPYGYNFAAGSDARLFVFLGSLLLYVFNDITSYNILIIFFLTLNGYFSFLFFNTIVHSRRLAFFGGLIYGYSNYVLAKGAGHINLMQVYGVPLLLYSLYVIITKRNRSLLLYLLCIFSFILISLSSVQYLPIAFGSLLIVGVIGCLTYWKYLSSKISAVQNKDISYLIISIVIGVIVFLVILFPFIKLILGHDFNPMLLSHSVPISSFLLPNGYFPTVIGRVFNILFSIRPRNGIDDTLFIGFIEICLFIILLIRKKTKFEVFIISCSIVFFILCLGNTVGNIPLPYAYLNRYIFPFTIIADPERFFIFFYVFFTLSILFTFKHFTSNRMIVIFVMLGIVLERTGFNYYHVDISSLRNLPYQKVVAREAGMAVLDLPLVWDNYSTFRGIEYNLLPFYYKKPIIEGYFNWLAETKFNRQFIDSEEIAGYYCLSKPTDSLTPDRNSQYYRHIDDLVNTLKKYNIRIIVVHRLLFQNDHCRLARIHTAMLLGDIAQEDLNLQDDEYKIYQVSQQNLGGSTYHLQRIYKDKDAIIYKLL